MTDRSGFIKNIARAGLFLVLAFIALALGKRVTRTGECSGCPESFTCSGRISCNKK